MFDSGNLTKKEFLKLPNLKTCRLNIRVSAIMLYICAAITILVGIFTDNLAIFLDAGIILGFALGAHLAQSRVCALIVCIYGIFNTISVLLSTGKLGGWLILIAGIDAVTYTFRFQKAWKAYQETGMIPPEQ